MSQPRHFSRVVGGAAPPPERARRAARGSGPRGGALAAALVATAAGLLAADASAAPPEAAVVSRPAPQPLTWHAPPGCGSAAEVLARVSELLGEPALARDEPLADVPDDVQVEARVGESRAGWALHLVVRDAAGSRQRELEAEQCGDLVEAAAIAITLAFEAARAEAAGPADTAPEPALEPAPPSGVPAAPPEPAPSAPDAAPTLHGGAELIIDLSSLAAVAAGPSFFVALDWDTLSLDAYATWLPGVDKSVGPAQAVELSLLAGGLRACHTLARGLLDTTLCAGVEAGRLAARGAGLRQSRVARDPWLAADAGLALSRPLGAGLTLQARGELVVPLLRQAYAVNETEAVYRVTSLATRIALGAELAF